MTPSNLKVGINGGKLTVRFRAASPAPDYGAGWSPSPRLHLPASKATSSPELTPPSTRPGTSTLPSTPGAQQKSLSTLDSFVRQIWEWLKDRRSLQFRSKRLTVTETVSLGDKRFVSIVKVDDRHFLIGGSASTVNLLTDLPTHPQPPEAFKTILSESWANARPSESWADAPPSESWADARKGA